MIEKSITIEQLEEFFESVGIKLEGIKHDLNGFTRDYKFEIDGRVFIINWWSNMCTLIIDFRDRCDTCPRISFNYVALDEFYPGASSKNYMAFYNNKYGNREFFTVRIPFDKIDKE